MERLTEWYDDGKNKGIMVKEAYGEKVLKTLFSEYDEGYLAMCKLKQYEDMEEQGKDIKPVHIDIIESVPDYFYGQPKRSKRTIKEIMKEYGYDEDYISNISNDFCQGFGVARYIIIKMLSEKYWKSKKEGENK